MRWRSPDGIWTVSVLNRGGQLRFEIRRHNGLVRAGWVSVLHAHEELDAVLAELGGPPLADMDPM